MPLSELTIKNAKPAERKVKLSDGGGLYLQINPAGTKTWKLAYRFGGKQKEITGGTYPAMKLADARSWREKVKDRLREGLDPARVVQIEKREAIRAQGETFEAVAREWHEKQEARWRPRHAAWVLRRLENDAFPVMGSLPVSEVAHDDVLELIRRLENRGALEVGRKVLQYVGRVMRYAISTKRADTNPVPDTRDAMKARPRVRHHAKLPVEKLPQFYSALDRSQHDPVTKMALRWTILTMVRTGEARFFRPEEIEGSGENMIWRIPGEKMKLHREHIVPLPRQARDLLDKIDKMARANGSPWQFPQVRNPKKPIDENVMLYCLYDLGFKGTATVHGFRGVASTWLNTQVREDGSRRFDSDWIELQLAHETPGGEVRGAYNAAEYLTQRRTMVQAWADFLDEQEAFGALL